MPLREFSSIVDDAVQRYERSGRTRVGRDAQIYLFQHAAPEIEEIDRRLKTGELTTELLTIGIIQLLETADNERPFSFKLRESRGGRFGQEIPEVAPLSRNDVARAVEKKCPVFPYCSDSSQCPH